MARANSEHKEALMSALDENSQAESASTEPLEPVAPLSSLIQVPSEKEESSPKEVQLSQEELGNSRQDFSKRQDVLGKTMVRSLKRFYLDLFNSSNSFKSFG